jgi:glycosyltransferase involved in cell wall biosynthesis
MKKIIFIHLLNDYSGSPKVLSQVIKAVQKDGYQVELYIGKSDDGFLSDLIHNHHHYFYKRFENKYLTLVTFMLSQASLFFKLLKHRNEDVIIYVNTMLPFGAGLAGKMMGKPVYYHIHETSLQPASFKRFLRSIVQKSASKVIFVSKAVEEVESFVNIPQKVIYNALPNSFSNVAVKSSYEHLRDENFNVLMICSLKAYKGVNEFVTIASLCQNISNIKFILILNAEQSDIEMYFQESSLPSNLTLIARQKNLVLFYEKTSLLLNLSRVDQWVETFGLTIIEAMAFGIPVIVPPIGGPAEIVNDGKEGYLISSYETDKISKLILELSMDETRCQVLSQNSKKRSMDFEEAVFEKKIQEIVSNIEF